MGEIISKMILMDINNSPNIILTMDMVSKSLNTFINKPIVLINKPYDDYNNKSFLNKSIKESIVGVITEVTIVEEFVVGTVLWYTEKRKAESYGNWVIYLNDNRDGFEFSHVEIYNAKEL